MSYPGNNENVLWLAQCYNLAKCFPDMNDWMLLLTESKNRQYLPFQHWLWREIWSAAQEQGSDRSSAGAGVAN